MDEDSLRTLTPTVIGVLCRRGADFAAAEDAVQDALVEAVRVWPDDPPRDPKGWLVTVAWRKFLDAARADTSRRHREGRGRERADARPGRGPQGGGGRHAPIVLPVRAPVPDTGFGRRAHAARGRRPDHAADRAGLPGAGGDHGPADQQGQADRLGRPVQPAGDVATVLRVLYLVFNEGYSGNVDRRAKAIRLTRQLVALTDDPEVAGLLALMLLHHARRASRTGPGGRLVPLGEQDRSRWDTGLITEGVAMLQAALARDRLGEYQAQAAIAALHADARSTAETDWVQIVEGGTTNCCSSPAARWCGSTARWRSGRPTDRRPAWRRWLR